MLFQMQASTIHMHFLPCDTVTLQAWKKNMSSVQKRLSFHCVGWFIGQWSLSMDLIIPNSLRASGVGQPPNLSSTHMPFAATVQCSMREPRQGHSAVAKWRHCNIQ